MQVSAQVQALSAKVWTTSNATLATVQSAVNDFLAGQGTPTLRDNAQLIGFELRSDGSEYLAVVLYTE